jgi:hypothetical protein
MNTITRKKSKESVGLGRNDINPKNIKKELVKEEPDMEVQIIQMNPSLFGMSVWKFFVVKDKK